MEALAALISTSRRPADAEVLRFPPVMSRAHLERRGYLKSFPHLLGCRVQPLLAASGKSAASSTASYAGEDWTDELEPADLVLAPAACYPVYPIAAARGPYRPTA